MTTEQEKELLQLTREIRDKLSDIKVAIGSFTDEAAEIKKALLSGKS